MTEPYPELEFTDDFLKSLSARTFTAADRAAVMTCLRLLNDDEKHPSLRVHLLHGDMAGQWSASASRRLRITYLRIGGRKRLLTCSKHYDR